MKKEKKVLLIGGFFVFACLVSFLTLSIKIPEQSIVRFNKGDEVFFEKTNSTIFIPKWNNNITVYHTGKVFNIEDYFYAKNRNEKLLKNKFSFSVMFPDEHICESDTALVFSQIRAHAYISMQKATNLINQDFYYHEKSYPKILEEILNQEKTRSLENLYFADVRISKISYENENDFDLDDMTASYLSNILFLFESTLYDELNLKTNI